MQRNSSRFRREFGEVFAGGGGEVAADRAVALSWGNGAAHFSGENSHCRLKTNQATRRRVAQFSASQPVALIGRRQFIGGTVLPAERLVEKTLADLDDKAK